MIDLIKEYLNKNILEIPRYEILNIPNNCYVIDVIEIAIEKYVKRYSRHWLRIRNISNHYNDSSYDTYTICIVNRRKQGKNKKEYAYKLEIDYPYAKHKADINYYLGKLKEKVSEALGCEAIEYIVKYD